jgi:hypothetical protein
MKGFSAMTRYILADVTTIELRPAGYGSWAHFSVTHVMNDGARVTAPAVNTVTQAEQRARDTYPNATVVEWPYLAGRRHPSIAYAHMSRPSGTVTVQALYGDHADATPHPGDYIAGGVDGDAPHGARSGYWSPRTTDDAETLLIRRVSMPGQGTRVYGWRVVTVGEARTLLEAAGFTIATRDRTRYETVYADEDPAGTWRPPLVDGAYSMRAFVVPV